MSIAVTKKANEFYAASSWAHAKALLRPRNLFYPAVKALTAKTKAFALRKITYLSLCADIFSEVGNDAYFAEKNIRLRLRNSVIDHNNAFVIRSVLF